jgi:glycine dehydrogenase
MSLPVHHYDRFENRHNGSDSNELNKMLEALGVNSIDQLIEETVPAAIRSPKPLNLRPAMGEQEFLTALRRIGAQNQVFKTYIGMGYYNTHTPLVILRNITENPGWYTAYTPYQAEIAQGRLEALINFQTMVMDLTGMEIANASLLDEATAASEAMHMCYDLKSKTQGSKMFIDAEVFPQTIDVLKTRAVPLNIELVIGDYSTFEPTTEYMGVVLQYPNNSGDIKSYKTITEKAHAAGAKVVALADLLALTLLTPPGEWGADIVVGTSQRFGVPLGYGGPHAGYMATKDEFKRSMPGRIIGVSIDAQGKTAYRMALQTREQHIKREKATSNICTAQVLLSVMAGMYAVYHGPEGLKKIAQKTHAQTKVLVAALEQLGIKNSNKNYFDTVRLSGFDVAKVLTMAEVDNINLRYFDNGEVGISLDETTTLADVQFLVDLFAKATASNNTIDVSTLTDNIELTWDNEFKRTSAYLTHEVFNSFHTEHEMLRYIKRLENKDLSLVHSMISLGSCTMKLNATAEMIPITWPEFNQIHPFVPVSQARGYAQVFSELESYLAEITGFAATSLQPNAGAQGEYAGLLVIREYFKSRGETHRNVALIPASAHGTNPASAVMAGMKVIVTKTAENGNIDVEDLKAKAEANKDNLACLMVTYPSTHGVFEETIKEITSIIHGFGGQVYMDGANMNAQVGLTSPGIIGADVCHLNLHKTFCIPHGGGGPGMGPICVAEHLKPFLPGHAVIKTGGDNAITAVSAAPWGSASILLISYAYIRMMGGDGLTNATKWAILNANYIAKRLEGAYDVLYKGKNGRCAHEMILDTRHFKATTGIEATDIAKRLMDYGYHAPTMSFPVANTIMVEPTESETKAELDKFIDAMLHIRAEIAEIEEGRADKEDNVLHNAPHTAEVVMADTWTHGYTREKAAFPTHWVRHSKFWPAVSRVDNTYGDRNLICACPPLEDYIVEPEQVSL